jgi:hypothetical protein
MSEEQEPRPSGAEDYAGEAGDPTTQGGEGQRKAAVTPPIGEDGVQGQTQTPAPEDDVGKPSQEEIERQAGEPDPGTTPPDLQSQRDE